MPFSEPDTMGAFEITPLGAAIVEAMPDRKTVASVKRNFKRGYCPSSQIFSANEVEAFYKARGKQVKAYSREEHPHGQQR